MTKESPILINLQRSQTGITVWLSHMAEDGTLTLSTCPLSELSSRTYPHSTRLLHDWHSLADARDMQSVQSAFWRVFWASLAENPENSPTPIPAKLNPTPVPKPTAAHPRAFKGTKYQPPKPGIQKLMLQAWLADDRLLDGFLAQIDLAQHPIIGPDEKPMDLGLSSASPSSQMLMVRVGSHTAITPPKLPETFRRHFLWSLRLRPVTEWIAWLRIWQGLNSPEHGQTLMLLARLCALQTSAHAWSKLALCVAPSRQEDILRAILKYKAFSLPCDALQAEAITALSAETENDERFLHYFEAILSNLTRGVSEEYTLCGCHLANHPFLRSRDAPSLLAEKDCEDVPVADILRMVSAVGPDNAFWIKLSWIFCSQYPGFSDVLRDTKWEQLSAQTAYDWIDIFARMDWEEHPKQTAARWQVIQRCYRAWHDSILTTPGPWQEKHIILVRWVYLSWEALDTMVDSLSHLLALMRRLCSTPYLQDYHCGPALGNLAQPQSESGWLALLEADDKVWLTLERACRRDNDESLITRGLYALAQAKPELTVQALLAAPKRLIETAHLLGCLGYDQRRQVVNSFFSTSAWFSENWQALEPLEACRRILQRCQQSHLDSPLPRRLREHIEGKITLREQQIDRHSRLTLQRLLPTQLLGLEEEVWRLIDAPFSLRHHSRQANHAVRFHASVRDNRKVFRRFMQAYSRSGDRFAHLEHPLNQAWFKAHPKLDVHLWARQGIRHQHGEICLALETDPLEVLMLGSYTGTCLGLGGLCDDSAIACLLDGNKQVVYARDQNGKVIARQLLAIDEQDRLICFYVYPLNTSPELLEHFRAYDEAFSQALHIPIFEESSGDYHVKTILANYWWDDGAWTPDKQEQLLT
ncbi:hypothetical protein [Uliginosibacterium gangwonense]|uniref:hypothetical protein n=1 Tax=Uliginosibacterium gangwonense TaxID=392736 RepID=UPI00035F9347|nr:hypothetical protein [Uliginosibacterium gangwonense]